MNGHLGPAKTVTVSGCHSKRCHCNRLALYLEFDPLFFLAGGCERPRPGGGGGGRAAVPAAAAAVPAAGRDPAARLGHDLGAEDAGPEERRVARRAGVSQKGEKYVPGWASGLVKFFAYIFKQFPLLWQLQHRSIIP